MGLAEKKIQQQFADKEIPNALKYYSEQTGGAMADMKVEIDWGSFGNDKEAYENLTHVWQQPLQGIEAVCSDDTGKSAVKESLKKIVIKNVKDQKESRIECKEGALTAYMNVAAGTQGSLGWPAYQKAVENGL